MLWIGFALMSVAAVLAVMCPLARKPSVDRAGSDLVVYQDQLEEIGRDRSAGLIGEAEAAAARVEVSRRLLAAADTQPQVPLRAQPLWHCRAAVVAALIVLLFLPVGLYAALGSPEIPGQPAYARAPTPQDHQTIANLIGQVEEHLAQNPNDGAGWQVIGPIYMRLGRFDDAVAAFRKSLALNGETAGRRSALGEALIGAANGVVTDEAKKEFERAIALDAREPKARFFLALADQQEGKLDAAADKWRAMLKDAPPNAPWAGLVRESLARVTGQPVVGEVPGPSQEEIAAAQDMPEAQRTEMIRGMVAKLADRLHADGGDVEDWVRLVRAYAVLGERERAKSAAAEAKKALAQNPDEIKRIDDLLKGLGLEG
jgi:cytochrome c-type biogenesis protein CcmH